VSSDASLMTTKYKVLNKRPLVMSVSPELIEPPRMDVDYYRPQFVEAVERLQLSGLPLEPLDNLRVSQRIITDGIRKHTKTKSGVVLIRTQNFDEVTLNLNDCVYVDLNQHHAAQKSAVRTGDLLIAVRGYLGKAVIIGSDVPTANINQHIARVSVNEEKADIGYLWAFFSSTLGKTLLERQVTGTVQQGIMLPAMRQFEVPLPPQPIQTYIGAKVRLAEQCRRRAGELREQGKSLLEQQTELSAIVTAFDELQKQKSHYVHPENLDDRMDPEFYQLGYLETEKTLKAKSSLRFKDLVAFPIKGIQPEYDANGTVPAITVTHIDPDRIDIASAQKVSQDWASSKTRARANAGEILITVTGPPLGETAVVHQYHCPLVINSHIARLKPRSEFPYPHYLTTLLNSPIGSIQVYRHCKGIRQKELYPDDLQNFVVPEVDLEIIQEIDRVECQADLLEHESDRLITEAKADVEALMEERLDVEGIVAGRVQPSTWEEVERELA
jgi:type I restriction enzyme S subunit